jgi:hypothetical protein
VGQRLGFAIQVHKPPIHHQIQAPAADKTGVLLTGAPQREVGRGNPGKGAADGRRLLQELLIPAAGDLGHDVAAMAGFVER